MSGVVGASGASGSVRARTVAARRPGDTLVRSTTAAHIKKRLSQINRACAAPLAQPGKMTTANAVAWVFLMLAPVFCLRPGSIARIINQFAVRSVDPLRSAPAQAPHWEGQGRQ